MFFSLIISLFSPLAHFFTKKYSGLDNLPDNGPFIIAVNHASFADPVMLDVVLKKKLKKNISKMYTIAKIKLIWKIFSQDLSKKLFNLLIVDTEDKKKVIRESMQVLRNDGIVQIFIEGTRTHTGSMQTPKTGVARLALETKAPVIPVGLKGTYEFWNRKKLLPRYYRDIEVHIGKEVDLSKYYKNEINKDLLNEMSFTITEEIKKLLK